MKLEFFKCIGIMLANLCHPYILSTTVLSDRDEKKIRKDGDGVVCMYMVVSRVRGISFANVNYVTYYMYLSGANSVVHSLLLKLLYCPLW